MEITLPVTESPLEVKEDKKLGESLPDSISNKASDIQGYTMEYNDNTAIYSDIIQGYTVEYNNILQYTVIYRDIQWSTTIYSDMQGYTVEYINILQYTVIYRDQCTGPECYKVKPQ